MQNIRNILTTIGHRFGRQSALDKSSGRNPTTILHEIAFPVELVFSKINIIIKYDKHILVLDRNTFSEKQLDGSHNKDTPAARLKRHKSGLGLPIHIQMLKMLSI